MSEIQARSPWLPDEAELKRRRKRRVMWYGMAVLFFACVSVFNISLIVNDGRWKGRWGTFFMLIAAILNFSMALKEKRLLDG